MKLQLSVLQKYTSGLPVSTHLIVWGLSGLVILLSLLNITGWVYDIRLFTNVTSHWFSMKMVTSVCFILAAVSFILNQVQPRTFYLRTFSGAIAAIVGVVSLFSLYVFLFSYVTGQEASITKVTWISAILSGDIGMSPLTSFNFLLLGSALLILSTEKSLTYRITHALIIPVIIVNYLIPVSYIIGLYSTEIYRQIPVAFNTGMTFVLFCMAVFLAKPDTWLLNVFTSRETGSIFIRKLLPALIAMPVIIGWLRIYGERKGFFSSDEGVALVAITYTISYLIFAWLTAKSVNLVDKKRSEADEALIKANSELDQRVKERTDELLKLNRKLDAEIVERTSIQEKLETEQKRFIDLVELLPAYLILLTPDYHVVFANRFFRERFGENRFQRRCFEYLFDRTEPCQICETYKTLKENQPQTWEWQGPDLRYYSIFDFPFTDTDGSPLIMEMGIDITELKNAEARLKDANLDLEERMEVRTEELLISENRYNALFKNMLESFALFEIIIDDHGNPYDFRYIAVNPAFERLTGLHAKDLIGKRGLEIYPAIDDFWIEMYGKVALTGESANFEHFSGNLKKYVRVISFSPKKGFFAIIFNDITERVIAERTLAVSKSKLDMALKSANIGIWEWDLKTGRFEWDQRMSSMFGFDSDFISGTFDDIEKVIIEEDLPHFQKAMEKAIENNAMLDTMIRIDKGNRLLSHINIKAQTDRDTKGQAVKMTGVVFDITGMRESTEKAIFRLNEDLLRSNRELEQFAYVASHDLQEPLRMVSSFTQLLYLRYKDKLDPDAVEFINYAVDGATRMQALINDLLEYSRITTRVKNLMPNDVHYILGQALKNLSLVIKEKNALVTNDELPVIQSDGPQLVLLFQNLIGNSIKFCTKAPRIHISAQEEQDHFLFTVADNGIGIESQYFDRIFQIFQRLHSRNDFSGTGIGLAICRRIVERHGGRIWVESSPGEGTTFKFTLKK